MTIAEEVARLLLQVNAVKLSPSEPFTWASGRKSPIYCDNRVTLSYPKVRAVLKVFLAEKSSQFPSFDTVGGVATAGIPHGTLLADALDAPFIYVRSKAKQHGLGNQIEGVLKPESRVLLVEDLISTGGSVLKAVDAIEDGGGKVSGILALFSYGFSESTRKFAARQITCHTLTTFPKLLEVAQQEKYITPAETKVLLQWQEDPVAWSDAILKKQF